MDVLPTFLDLAGIKQPETIDALELCRLSVRKEVRDAGKGAYKGQTGMRAVKKKGD
jgi:arylsulfatase A-like enzyme